MKRLEQIILVITFVAFSWLAMQAVHELGHVIGAWATGAVVSKVALHPLIFSRTDLNENPHPLAVVWSGPIVGAVLPLLAYLLAKVCRFPGAYLFRFFAGFCLIANGAYIAFGPGTGPADTGIMMRYSSPRWLMVLFGLLTAPLGLYLWNNQGGHFGLGEANSQISRSATVVSTALLIVLVGAELFLDSK